MAYVPITIPAGKKVVISSDQAIKGAEKSIELLLNEDIQLTFSSKFEDLVSGDVAVAESIFTAATKALGYQLGTKFKEFGAQRWAGTDPLSFTINTTLSMKTNALTDVWLPAKSLIKLVLPTDLNTTGKGKGLGSPIPDPLEILKSAVTGNALSGSLTITIGNIIMSPCFIKRAEPTFSKEVDMSNYPIWATFSIEIQTLYTATKSMIDRWR